MTGFYEEAFHLHPIGIIHSPFTDKSQTPIQASRSNAMGTVEIFDEFTEGLDDIDGFSHLILIYYFHKVTGYKLRVKPFLDDKLHGLFATRYPHRPNPIGISIVYLVKRPSTSGETTDTPIPDKNILQIQGVDVLDGTPLLDIKPYIPEFDAYTNVRTGWYATRSIK